MVVASPRSRPTFRFYVVLCSDRPDVRFEWGEKDREVFLDAGDKVIGCEIKYPS